MNAIVETRTGRYLGPRQTDEPVEITLVLRRAAASAATVAPPCHADDADVAAVHAFAATHGLEVVRSEPGRRVVRLRGTVGALQSALAVELGYFESEARGRIGGCRGTPRLPDDLAPRVMAVLGLDQRPVAEPRFRRPRAQPTASFTPPQLGTLYGFPAQTDGSGQTIAIIELGGGYREQDLTTYFGALGIPVPQISAVDVDGGSNTPGSAADGEVMLDIEVAGALAPKARLMVYFAPNTDQGFHEAVSRAIHDTAHPATVMSISWGGPEDTWAASARNALDAVLQDAATLGVTVTTACGDNGSGDGEKDGKAHVDFPSSSPHVLACGGTRLQASGGRIASEVVWNEMAKGEGATGGGVSQVFPRPAYQASTGVPAAPDGSQGRGVPDVAAVADPLTGYRVRVDGKDEVIGGTSAVAPLWAALVARLNQATQHPLGAPHKALYTLGEHGFHDITQGDNGDYSAGPGWDACTGWGSPNGSPLLQALRSQAG